MKKKLFCLSFVLLSFICTVFAQKPKIYIAPFKYSGKDLRNLLPQFRSAVVAGVNYSNRFDITESMDNKVLTTNEIFEAAQAEGADYILQCELFNHNLADAVNVLVAVADAVDKKSGYLYDNVSYNAKLTRVKDRVVINSSKLSNTGGSSTGQYAHENALDGATKNVMMWVTRQMSKYIQTHFPIEARIVEFDQVKDDKVQTLYINLGTQSQVTEKALFVVYRLKPVANDKVREQIGQLRVEKVNGDHLSLCKVQKGGKEIYEAVQNGQELLIISTVK